MSDERYGRLGVALIALLLGIPLLGALVGIYISTYGTPPFTFRPGPLGLPPWLPFFLLLGVLGVAAILPILLHQLHPRETTFYEQISTNRRNAVLLTIAITCGLALVAYVIGTVLSLRTTVGLFAGIAAIVTGVVAAVVSLRAGDRIVLRVSGATPIDPASQTVLRDVVAELAVAADIPPPVMYLIDSPAPNAFAIGRDPAHAAVAVTSGLLGQLDREELQGVVAHELSHIRNGDSRYDLFVAILVGMTVLIVDGFFRVVTFPFQVPYRIYRSFAGSEHAPGSGSVHGSGSGGGWSFPDIKFPDIKLSGGGKGSGVAIILAIIIFVILVIVVSAILYAIAPLFARMTQAAVSREREYLADASAVELGRNPEALERALLKVASSDRPLEAANRATAPLYFVNPIRAFEKRASTIYSTHPRTLDRVNRLRELQGQAPLGEDSPEARAIAEDED